MKLIKVFNNKKSIAFLVVFTVIGITLIFTQYFGFFPLSDEFALDMLNYYTKTQFFNNLESLDRASRASYLMIHLADYLFMFGFYQLIAILIFNLSKSYNKIVYISLLPYFSLAFDFIENILFDIHLSIYPHQIGFLGSLAGISSYLKFNTLYISIIIVILLYIYRLIDKVFFNEENKII